MLPGLRPLDSLSPAEDLADSHRELRSRLDALARSWPDEGPLWILEVGCGSGQASRVSCEHIFACTAGADTKVFLLDADASKVARAVDEVPPPSRSRHTMSWTVADFYQTPFCPESFDTVIAFNVFHWVDRQRFFFEVFRLLKPTGRLFLYDRLAVASQPATRRIIHFELARHQLQGYRRA